jgi:hypothetical protein
MSWQVRSNVYVLEAFKFGEELYKSELPVNQPHHAHPQEDDHKFWDVLNPADNAHQPPADPNVDSKTTTPAEKAVKAEVMGPQVAFHPRYWDAKFMMSELLFTTLHLTDCRTRLPLKTWPSKHELSSV